MKLDLARVGLGADASLTALQKKAVWRAARGVYAVEEQGVTGLLFPADCWTTANKGQ